MQGSFQPMVAARWRGTPGRIGMAMVLMLTLLVGRPAAAASSFSSYAHVADDATLKIRNRKVRLYGIYLPKTAYTCQTYLRPVRCAHQAVLALDRKIGAKFVRCFPKIKYRDRSIAATCYVDGEDLAAYLISQGWALAAPGAPFEYEALGEIARHRDMGVWGFPSGELTLNPRSRSRSKK